MKALKKGLGFFFIGIGALILIMTLTMGSESTGTNIILFIMGLIPVVVGIALLKNKKTEETPTPVLEAPPKAPPKKESYIYSFKVAGISNYQDDVINKLMDDCDLWTWNKQEIIEYDHVEEKMRKYESDPLPAELVPEPDNQYDPNAIKVMVEDVLVGYVPAAETDAVRQVLSGPYSKIICELYGGPYKILIEDYDDLTDKSTYRMETHDDNKIGRAHV